MNNLLEQMYMDINNFSESSIRIGDTDLELFLSPFYANPQKINNWDVPIAIAPLESMRRPDWDVTLHKVSFVESRSVLYHRETDIRGIDLQFYQWHQPRAQNSGIGRGRPALGKALGSASCVRHANPS